VREAGNNLIVENRVPCFSPLPSLPLSQWWCSCLNKVLVSSAKRLSRHGFADASLTAAIPNDRGLMHAPLTTTAAPYAAQAPTMPAAARRESRTYSSTDTTSDNRPPSTEPGTLRLPCRVTSTSSTVMRTTVCLRSLPIASAYYGRLVCVRLVSAPPAEKQEPRGATQARLAGACPPALHRHPTLSIGLTCTRLLGAMLNLVETLRPCST